jgi:hypothetical protein
MRCVHYVGFRDDRYLNALRVFGGPAFVHRWWDARARREIGPDDIVVFADGPADQAPRRFNAPDLDEA